MVKVKTVIFLLNGLVAVFGEDDEQIPDLQGPIFHVIEKIGVASDIDTRFYYGLEEVNLKWYFEKYQTSGGTD